MKSKKTGSDNITLTAVKWIDTRSVCLLSSFLQANPLQKCKRFDKKKLMLKLTSENVLNYITKT